MPELAVLDALGADAGSPQATEQDQGLGILAFRSMMEDIKFQPSWRKMADKCAEYVDGNSLDPETMEALDQKGMGPLNRNIIAPIINVVLGLEAKTRADWRVASDDDQWAEVAEAQSAKLHEAERESRADRAVSDAYAGQIKAGLGWVEVSPNFDPFGYKYRCEYLHRRELFWDWRDLSADLNKARFVIRKRWFDLDQAAAYFPDHKELFYAALGDPYRYELMLAQSTATLGQALEETRGITFEDLEQWRSMSRKRLCLYEVWYRQFVRGYICRLPNEEVIEFNQKDPRHLALANRMVLRPEPAVYAKLRFSLWAGPHKLMDIASPKRELPYVPFWGYREDLTGVPYGLTRSMLSPQDEVNARLQKMMWLLGAKRVVMDSDALDPAYQGPQDMLAEISRPDAVVILDPKRQNRDAYHVDDNLSLAEAQFKVLLDAKQAAQEVVGVFNAMLGRDSKTESGTAINNLVEQGMTALAEINDNYRYGRRLVGERLLDLIRDDMIGQRVDVVVQGQQAKKRLISLNAPVQRQQQAQPGQDNVVQMVKNNVQAAKTRVALEDVASTPAYRGQQFTMLAEMVRGLPQNIQALVIPFVVEASELQHRRQIAKVLRQAIGQQAPMTPEEEQAFEQQQAQAQQFVQQIQQKQAMLELAEREAKVNKINAEAEKIRAEIQGNPALAGAQAQHQAAVMKMQEQARGEIDRLTAEKMTLQMNAAQREQKLLAELNKVVGQLQANAGGKEAELRKAEIEREIAEIDQARDLEVARIKAASDSVVTALTDQIAGMRADFDKQLQAATERTTKAVEALEHKHEKAEAKRDAAEAKREAKRQAAQARQSARGSK